MNQTIEKVYVVAEVDCESFSIRAIMTNLDEALEAGKSLWKKDKEDWDELNKDESEEIKKTLYYDRYVVYSYLVNKVSKDYSEDFSETLWDSDYISMEV